MAKRKLGRKEVDRLVIGCGYLGWRVAMQWLDSGDNVFAVTRSAARAEEFRSRGITPIVADVTDVLSLSCLPDVATVLFSVGFDRERYKDIREVYVNGFNNVLQCLPSGTQQLIYISTTGVYGGQDGGLITEMSPVQPERPGSKASWQAEENLRQSVWREKSIILRMAGIYGPQRVPRLSVIRDRRWSELNTEGFLNLIHVDDAANSVVVSANLGLGAETFNVSDGSPVCRAEFYQYIADRLDVGRIPVETGSLQEGMANKRVCSKKFLERTGISLAYSDFRQGIDQSLHG